MTEDSTGTGEDADPEAPAAGGGGTDGEAGGETDGVDGGDRENDSGSASETDDVASMYDQSPTVGAEDLVSADDDEVDMADTADVGESDGESSDSGVGVSLLGDDDETPELESGTFYVKHTEETAVTLHEVNTGQICTLIENPGLRAHDLIEATLMAQPPMEVSYVIHELHERWNVPIEVSQEPPTRQVQTAAAKMDSMQAVAIDREGEGEIHVLTVDPSNVDRTVEELADDEMTYKNAARYGVERVEIRTDEDEGIVSIRYLP